VSRPTKLRSERALKIGGIALSSFGVLGGLIGLAIETSSRYCSASRTWSSARSSTPTRRRRDPTDTVRDIAS